jgi:hypothetical protein
MRVYTVTQLKSQCFCRTELSELKLSLNADQLLIFLASESRFTIFT